MHSVPVLYSAASGARSGGISVATFNSRVKALGTQPVAFLRHGRRRQPLYSQQDICLIVLPYIAARDIETAGPELAAEYSRTEIRESLKAETVRAAEEDRVKGSPALTNWNRLMKVATGRQ